MTTLGGSVRRILVPVRLDRREPVTLATEVNEFERLGMVGES
jgi:hypothetical protein